MAGQIGAIYGGRPTSHLGMDKTHGVFYRLALDTLITAEIMPTKQEDMTLQEEMSYKTAPVRAFVLAKFGAVT